MAAPTRTDLLGLDWSCQAQPFVSIASKSGIDLDGLDWGFQAQPFWGYEVTEIPSTSIKAIAGVSLASIKKVGGIAIASVKKIASVSNVS